MLLRCIVCILIIIDVLFATKEIKQHLTNTWGLGISTLIHRIVKDRTVRNCIRNSSLFASLVNYLDWGINKLLQPSCPTLVQVLLLKKKV